MVRHKELYSIVQNREILFKSNEHSDLKAEESAARPSAELDLVDWLPCVACKAPMKRLNFSYNSGIVIDRCTQGHGVWLENQELERVQVFAERWADKAPELKSKYSAKLEHVRLEAETSYDKAVQEGRNKFYRATMMGRMLRKMK